MNKDKQILKDQVLNLLVNNKKGLLRDTEIANRINRKGFEVRFAAEELAADGLVELTAITGSESPRNEYLIRIINKGLYFLKYDSFTTRYKLWRREQNWKIVKIFAAVLNASIIIAIAAISVYVDIR